MMPLPEAVPESLAIGLAGAVVITGPLLLYARRLVGRVRGERDAAAQKSRLHQQALEEEMEHLVSVRLPALLGNASGASVTGMRHSILASTRLAAHQQAVLDQAAEAMNGERAQADSARAAFLVMADRIQVMALAQQQGLDALEQSAVDPVLMAGLMQADHAAAQLARQAQTMTVLCGAWLGRQWPSAISLVDVVRGAQSRILEYQRVQVQGSRELAVKAPVVEALIHAVAELLDNATRYSPPTVAVLVAIRPVHSGAIIEIDDGGLGMTEQALVEADRRLRGLRDVEGRGRGGGDSPQLGLAAVGRLAGRYGFSVRLDSPSAYGGVRAVLLVPSVLLVGASQAPATLTPPRAQGLQHTAVAGQPEGVRLRPDDAVQSDEALPQRRSHRDRGLGSTVAPGPVATAAARSPDEAAAFMSSFQAGTRMGREQAAPPPGHNP
ncbi:ATP-binding protein [Streptomyces flavidovirens]|uniref:histidine kinase n=1 Tax=Streptomyces flavidovirens TaxID=67298 RepID=A0ABW6RB01_9ACTN